MTIKEKLTRELDKEEIALAATWGSAWLLGFIEKEFGLNILIPLSISLLVVLIVGLAGMVLYFELKETISYFMNTPWWWKISSIRNRKLNEIFTNINNKAFGGKLPNIKIQSTYKPQVINRRMVGEYIITSWLKGECNYFPYCRNVKNITIFGFFTQEELLSTMAHEVAHAFQVYDLKAEVAHDSYFKQVFKYICKRCGIKADMNYKK